MKATEYEKRINELTLFKTNNDVIKDKLAFERMCNLYANKTVTKSIMRKVKLVYKRQLVNSNEVLRCRIQIPRDFIKMLVTHTLRDDLRKTFKTNSFTRAEVSRAYAQGKLNRSDGLYKLYCQTNGKKSESNVYTYCDYADRFNRIMQWLIDSNSATKSIYKSFPQQYVYGNHHDGYIDVNTPVTVVRNVTINKYKYRML